MDSQAPVLVVEDDPALQRVIAMVLEDAGYPVITAGDGREGLLAIERMRPAVVLLDMRMPIMNGREFSRCLREQYGREIPVVLLSAERDGDQLDADAYLQKPFDIDELTEVVARYYAAA